MKRWLLALAASIIAATCAIYAWYESHAASAGSSFVPIDHVSFMRSVGADHDMLSQIWHAKRDRMAVRCFRDLYMRFGPREFMLCQEPRIPKIIHQIWLGPNPLPPCFAYFHEKIKKLHPGWEIRLWRDEDLEGLDPKLLARMQRTTNFAERSDIARCAILLAHGGVYLDTDIEMLKPLDELHHALDLYVGLEPPHKTRATPDVLWCGISVIGACPNHPVIKEWRRKMILGWEKVNRKYEHPVARSMHHTFFSFTKAFLNKAHAGKLRNVAFPPTYFYPLSQKNAKYLALGLPFDQVDEKNAVRKIAFATIMPESITVHYWGGSWGGRRRALLVALEEKYRTQNCDKQTLSGDNSEISSCKENNVTCFEVITEQQ